MVTSGLLQVTNTRKREFECIREVSGHGVTEIKEGIKVIREHLVGPPVHVSNIWLKLRIPTSEAMCNVSLTLQCQLQTCSK